MHIREVDEYGELQSRGGVTIAYTIDRVTQQVYAAWVKCKEKPTLIPELLAKQSKRRLTVLKAFKDGYTTEEELLKNLEHIRRMRVTNQELFCYETGRQQAASRLAAPDGDFEVLDLTDPVSVTLADWIATDVWPNGPESRDMGFPIEVYYDDNIKRWCSDFCQADGDIGFDPGFDVSGTGNCLPLAG